MHTQAIVRHIPAFELIAVADPQIDRAWAHTLAVPIISNDPGDVFVRDDLDAVIICAASEFHVELIRQAARHHLEIFCEKPIAFDPAVLAQLDREVRDAGVKLMVGLNRRFDPEFRALRRAIAGGKVGQPQLVRITNRDPKRPALEFVAHSGGLFMDFTVHDFDMARYLTGEDIAEVYAMGAGLVDPRIADLGDIDTAIVSLRMNSGALCVIDNSREAVYGYDQRIEVLGPLGAIEAQNVSPLHCVVSNASGIVGPLPHRSFAERYAKAYTAELEAFAACIREDAPVPVGVPDMLKAVEAARAAQQSLRDRRAVRL
jgi:myo-inositol 2-dehydrogenase / D-chiro-inositol 1-dehydrogenase